MSDAVPIILALCASLLGNDKQGAGLLVLREGRWHTPKCPEGQWLTPGLRGDPCGKRCIQTNAALDAAEAWLKQQERRRPSPLGAEEEVAS